MEEDDAPGAATPVPPTPQPAASNEPEFKKLKTQQVDTNTKVSVLQDKLNQLAAEVANINYVPKYIVGKKAHLPDHREKIMTPREWVSKCGWAYGMSRFRRSDEIGDRCRKCFNLSTSQEGEVAEEDSSSSDSSSS